MENLVQRQDILEFESSIDYSLPNEYINFLFNSEVDVVKNKTFSFLSGVLEMEDFFRISEVIGDMRDVYESEVKENYLAIANVYDNYDD